MKIFDFHLRVDFVDSDNFVVMARSFAPDSMLHWSLWGIGVKYE